MHLRVNHLNKKTASLLFFVILSQFS
jgi:hypothetical protein